MNLHQFRFVQEAVRRNLNLTETAKALFTSQPGVSKAILELEDELGVDIFARHGKRLRRVTEPGQQVLKRDRGDHARGRQPEAHRRRVLASRTPARCRSRRRTRQARYVLPEPVAQLRKRFPKVNVSLHQGTPEQVAQMVLEEVGRHRPRHRVARRLRRPRHAALLRVAARAGAAGRPPAGPARPHLARGPGAAPLISYHPSFTGRTRIDAAFAHAQARCRTSCSRRSTPTSSRPMSASAWASASSPRWRCATTAPGGDLVSRPLGHLFGQNVARVAFKRGAYLRNFVYAFAEMISRPPDAAADRARDGRRRRRLPALTATSA